MHSSREAYLEAQPRDAEPYASVSTLAARYQHVRRFTETLCQPLTIEDYVIQSMPDASPAKWHLAHTSWFFETFLLKPYAPRYCPLHPQYSYLFNSYYVGAGERFARPQRGLLSRPTVKEIYQYRAHVDEAMCTLLARCVDMPQHPWLPIVELGLHHEQQHQELLLTDIKHVFAMNPLRPVYAEAPGPSGLYETVPVLQWQRFGEGVYRIGQRGPDFAFDNESPRHRVFLQSFQLATRLVTAGEFLEFIAAGGYTRPELWLADGWNTAQAEGWQAPLYWEYQHGQWWQMTLTGMRPVQASAPLCHVSYYEAEAYARWAQARLPTEAEWEVAAAEAGRQGNFVESQHWHPTPCARQESGSPLMQMFGDVWEWTQSPYAPYPGYRPGEGTLGEYNGKFMCNQFVLRGGSCVTSATHIRPTYRNFFPPQARWQFTGLRLARD